MFGSYATGKYQPDSDIDITVVVKEKPDVKRLAEYNLLVDHARHDADLLFCTEEQLISGKYVFGEILREGILIYENV